MSELLNKVKANLILAHAADDTLLEGYITAAVSYAESYQHLDAGFYSANTMPPTTEQAVIIPATNLATKGDSITFSTPTIEGTVLRRNKADTRGKHPWKAEVTEGETGVTASTITGWYTSVYEPTYPTNSQSGGNGN